MCVTRPRRPALPLPLTSTYCFMLGLGLTGYLLPWDNKAYFATKVTLEIANTVPTLGPIIKEFLQGGTIVGAQTLTRFFALHVFFLPAVLLAACWSDISS